MHITRRTLLATSSGLPLLAAAGAARALDPTLVEAANQEGQITWYTTLIVTQIVRPMAAAFEAKYPKIKVATVPAPWQDVAFRIASESRAGAVKADVFDGGVTFYPLNAAGLVDHYIPEASANYPADYKEPSGLWTANIVQITTAAVNTDEVPEAQRPRTLEDLLDPRWKGRMAWTDSDNVTGPPGFVGNVLLTMGQDKGMDYLKRLATQKIANVSAVQRVILDQAIAGQYPLVLCIFNYHAAISIAQGAPVEWLKLAPLVTCGSICIVKGAPHPHAARLFTEFNLSDEGQQIYAKAGYIPASPAVPATAPSLKPDAGHYDARVISRDAFNAHQSEWTGIYKALFQ